MAENIQDDTKYDEKYLDNQAQQGYEEWQIEKQAQIDEEAASIIVVKYKRQLFF